MSWYRSHSFLNEYILKHNCKKIMEIGVLNGENARVMLEIAKKNFPPEEIEYYGFDFFYGSEFLVRQKLEKTGCNFTLFKGDSVVTLPKVVKTLPKMDLIFIDGGKTFSEASSDWINSKRLMHDGTAIFIHNYDFSGVRRMVDAISREKFTIKMIRTSFDSDTALVKKRLSEVWPTRTNGFRS